MFGDKQFELEYFPAGNDEERFVLKINQKIKITEPVQLTYKVVLQNPKTEAGTYGKYDRYGVNGYDGLFTNNSAVINPVDSNERAYAAQAFNKPTVSYTVAASTTPGDDNNQGKAGKTGKTAKTGDEFPMGLIAGAVCWHWRVRSNSFRTQEKNKLKTISIISNQQQGEASCRSLFVC